MTETLKYDDIVEEISIESLSDLREQIVYNKKFQRCIYRGHSKSESFKLVPSILRLEGISLNEKREDFYIKELRLLLQFYLESNKHGLYVPNIPSFFQFGAATEFDLSLVLKDLECTWLPNEVVELAALAQHYGIHTRLLDWTQDIRVALYFAASGVEESQKENMAVWCINAGDLTDIGEFFDRSHETAEVLSYDGQGDHLEKWEFIRNLNADILPLRFFIPHYDVNSNINAQKGILSIWQYNLLKDKECVNEYNSVEELRRYASEHKIYFLNECIKEDTKPLEILILDYFNQNGLKQKEIKEMTGKMLYKVIIKKELKKELLNMLLSDGYNRARIYPGYNGVAEMIMNHEV